MTARPFAAGPPSTLPPALQAALRAADVGDDTLYLAGEIASWAPGLTGDDAAAWELLALASCEAQRRGDTRTPLANDALAALLASVGVPVAARPAVLSLAARLTRTPALAALVGAPGDYKPFIVDGGHLYQQRVLAIEERLATALRQRLARALPPVADADLDRALALGGGAAALSDEQRAALRSALTRPLTVVTGGPGSGKTSVIVALLRAATALGIDAGAVALAAPTGKAANRINESLAARRTGSDEPATPVAQTLHRLLGFRPAAGDFRHHRHHRLPQALVVVDESSMIDLGLMERLAGAVRDDARLVLLGDADQLPSVEAGAVFRDLLPLALRLTRSYRMDPATSAGRVLLEVATAVRAGQGDALPLISRARPADLTFEGVELLDPTAGTAPRGVVLERFLDRWRAKSLQPPREAFHFVDGAPADADRPALAAAFAQAHRQRILCVTRGAARPTGAASVNAALHRQAAPHATGAPDFVPGEPLLMSRNDYDRGLFNGDLGLCLRVTDQTTGGTFTAAVFPHGDSFRAYPLGSLQPDLELAYALTVHRAQGSELDAVALILPDDELPLVSRELLYTALTRARTSVTIVGARSVLAAGVARRIQRSCGLAERLARRP